MAGIIDVRRIDYHRWVAQPRFAYDRESLENGAPAVEGVSPMMAVYNLAERLPEEMRLKLIRLCPEHFYQSPEYEYERDKCIDMDGHFPTMQEFRKRRSDYLLQKKLGRDHRSVHY